MYERRNYEMTEEDEKSLMHASKPTRCMMVGAYTSPSPQENANRAWQELGKKMGFDYLTVQPIPGKDSRFFSAIPSETAEARSEGFVTGDELK